VADADGMIRLAIPAGPAGAEYDLAIVLVPNETRARPKTPEELGWPPGYIESAYGAITDETFVRPPQPPLPPPLELFD